MIMAELDMGANSPGRPCNPDSRRNGYKLWLNDEEMNLLNFMSESTGVSRAKILRNALNVYAFVHGFKDESGVV